MGFTNDVHAFMNKQTYTHFYMLLKVLQSENEYRTQNLTVFGNGRTIPDPAAFSVFRLMPIHIKLHAHTF